MLPSTRTGDGLGMPESNTDRAAAGEAVEGLPGSKSVARAAEAALNQGDPTGSRRTNYEGQAGRGVQRQEERPEARSGVGFVHSSPWQDARLEAGEGTNRLTKHAQATRCRKNDGSIAPAVARRHSHRPRRAQLRPPVPRDLTRLTTLYLDNNRRRNGEYGIGSLAGLVRHLTSGCVKHSITT